MVAKNAWPEVLPRYSELSTGHAFRITGKVQLSFDVPSLEAERNEKLGYQGVKDEPHNLLSEIAV